MPTNRTKRARVRAGSLDPWKVEQLRTGECLLAGVGYGADIAHGCNSWSAADWANVRAAMEADWQRHGAELIDLWGGQDAYAIREFGAPG